MRNSSNALPVSNEPWLTLPSSAHSSGAGLEKRLQEKVSEQIQAGRYRVDDVLYIKAMKLSLPQGALSLEAKELERMRQLCQLWEVRLQPPKEIRSHRKVIGPLIVGVKRAIYPIINFFLKDVLRRQRDFNAAVVHYLLMQRAPLDVNEHTERKG